METLYGIMSMTGYGKAVWDHELLSLEVEVRSVNSRFLDLVFKLPRAYLRFEAALREVVSERLQRGRVEVSINRMPRRQEACRMEFNRALFDSYFQICQSLAKEFKCFDADFKSALIREILFRREVVSCVDEAVDPEFEQRQLIDVLGQALHELCAMRSAEGAKLYAEICTRLERLRGLHAQVVSCSQKGVAHMRERFLERLQRLAPGVSQDPARLAAECALLAERLDITEELVRLESHLTQFEAAIQSPPCGRKLEFILQEMGREFNTVSSKAQDMEVQRLVIEAKCEIEKLREQTLNIE